LFAEHAVGGIIGLFLNGFFGSADIIALDGVNTLPGGFMDRNWKQLYIQFTYIVAVSAYSFTVTAAIAKIIDMIPGLKLRGTPESEKLGMDEVEVLTSQNCLLAFGALSDPYISFFCHIRSENSQRITSNCVVTSQTALHLSKEENTVMLPGIVTVMQKRVSVAHMIFTLSRSRRVQTDSLLLKRSLWMVKPISRRYTIYFMTKTNIETGLFLFFSGPRIYLLICVDL
jgi:hypothetical protein